MAAKSDDVVFEQKHSSKSRNSKASHSKTEKKIWSLFEGPMKNPKQELLVSKKHSSKPRNSKGSHSKTESKLWTLFEGPLKNPKQELLLTKKHSSKSRNSKGSHSKTESKLVTLFEGPMKNPKQELLLTKKHSKPTQKVHSESLRQVRCHHQRSNPSSQCAGCQPAYLDVSSSSFDALAALYSDDFVYPDSSAEVLDNVETFIARLERFGNVDRPRQKTRSSGRN